MQVHSGTDTNTKEFSVIQVTCLQQIAHHEEVENWGCKYSLFSYLILVIIGHLVDLCAVPHDHHGP